MNPALRAVGFLPASHLAHDRETTANQCREVLSGMLSQVTVTHNGPRGAIVVVYPAHRDAVWRHLATSLPGARLGWDQTGIVVRMPVRP